MKVIQTELPDILILEPVVYGDDRGFLLESYNKRKLQELGIVTEFVQDNHSHSVKNVLRGLHYQLRQPQGKLVRVTTGAVFDVGVDIRKSSPTFGKWVAVNLSAENKRVMWIPPGFAHGFQVLSNSADLLYKMTDYYVPELERTILWNDPEISIEWPIQRDLVLSPKDRAGTLLKVAEVFA